MTIVIHMSVSLAVVECIEQIHCQVYVKQTQMLTKYKILTEKSNLFWILCTKIQVGCELPSKVPRDHLYRVGPAYSLNNETDIMIEIFESGPVQGKILCLEYAHKYVEWKKNNN